MKVKIFYLKELQFAKFDDKIFYFLIFFFFFEKLNIKALFPLTIIFVYINSNKNPGSIDVFSANELENNDT